MSLESQLQARLLLVAPERLPDLRLFRRNVGTVNMYGRKVHFAIAGQCDLYGIFRGGKHIEIELKGVKTPVSQEQMIWSSWCVEWGVTHVFLRAKKDETVEQTVERWCQELVALVAR